MEVETKCLVTQEALKGKLTEIISSHSKTPFMNAIRWSHCIVRKMTIGEIYRISSAVYNILFCSTKRDLLIEYQMKSVNIEYNLNSTFTAVLKFEDGEFYYTIDFSEKSLRLSVNKKSEANKTFLSLWIPYRDSYRDLEELKFFCPLICRLKRWIDIQTVFSD